MRFHLATAILLSVLAGSNAQQQEPERKPRPILSAAFQGNDLLSRSHRTDTYYKRKKSESPSYMPSSDPSSSPSDVPSASPSDAPSDVPSTVPSSSPSANPSTSPSNEPSTVPSSSPSANPSTSPSNEPSTVPSSSPSANPSNSPSDEPSTVPSSSPSDESDRVLYIGDPMTCSTKVTIGEVEETLGAFLIAMDKMAIMENLKDSSPTLQMMSLGLSKSIESESSNFGTEQIVAEKIESSFFPLLDALNNESRENFNELIDTFTKVEKAVAVYTVDLMEGIGVLKEDFKAYITSRSKFDEFTRLDRTEKFRKRCNAIDSKPIDIFRHLYRYGCGDSGITVACESEDFGVCRFGPKGAIHVSELPANTMDIFYRWVSATLVELSLLHAVCLPAIEDTCYTETCIDPNILSTDESFLMLRDAMNEVIFNTSARSNCKVEGGTGLEICRVNSQGYSISPRDSEYEGAKPVFASDALVKQVTGPSTGTKTARSILKKVEQFSVFAAGAATSGVGLSAEGTAAFQRLSTFSAAFGGVGAALTFAIFFLPTPNPTLNAVRAGFRKVDARLDALSTQVKNGLQDVNEAFDNDKLDDFTSVLEKIKLAYSKYMSLAEPDVMANPSYGTLVEQYREEFRFACNDLDTKPENIIRDLYGYACGSNDFSDRCEFLTNANAGVGTGQCLYGTKKNNFLIDEYFIRSNTVTEFRTFSAFMKGALLEALFLQKVCLPPVPDSCIAETDSIRDEAFEISVNAIKEVEDNLRDIEKCFCPCGILEFKELEMPDDGDGSDADVTKAFFTLKMKNFNPDAVGYRDNPDRPSSPRIGDPFYSDEWSRFRPNEYKADVLDLYRGELQVPESGVDLSSYGTKYLSVVRQGSNYFYRAESLDDLTSYSNGKPSFPIQAIESVSIYAKDNDTPGFPFYDDDEEYRNSISLGNSWQQYTNMKCTTVSDSITVELPEDGSSDTAKFKFDVIKQNQDQCNRLASAGSFCSQALPDCPSSNYYYCDFDAQYCKRRGQRSEACGVTNPCQVDLECIDGICQYPNDVCKTDTDCSESEYCDLTSPEDVKECKNKFSVNDAGHACARSGQCRDSYCNNDDRKCTAFEQRGDSCTDTKECEPDLGLQCVDGMCKDDLNEPCFSNENCETTPGLYCDGTACKDRKDNGSECAVGSECKSGFCDPSEGRCENN